MCEILAPAGGKNSALAAINSGADAIYLGLSQFSARSSAENFDEQSFNEIVRYAHAFGVKVYVAMNTLIKNSELDGFLCSLKRAWNGGADAIILSDVFLGKFVKSRFPQIKLHLSTQAGVCNVYGALLAREYGFERVILARETAFEDIKTIAKIIETEVFVQGALCTCLSGQCYLSSFAGGNSGNRGRCKQPCRKRYSIDRNGFGEEAYRISLSDLSVGEDIKKFAEAGVSSFKIEGRMRRAEYVAASVKYYRDILDGAAAEVLGSGLSDLKRTFNRGNYTKGLAFGQEKDFISYKVQGHIGEFVGTVKVENGKFLCLTSTKCQVGDSFKVLRGGKEIDGADFFKTAKGGMEVTSKTRLLNGDKLFITTDTSVNSRLLSVERKLKIKVSARFLQGKPAEIEINGFTFKGGDALESAKNRPLTAEDIQNCFKKTDKYPFDVQFGEVITDGVFVTSANLNAVRRQAYGDFYRNITESKNERAEGDFELPQIPAQVQNKQQVQKQNKNQSQSQTNDQAEAQNRPAANHKKAVILSSSCFPYDKIGVSTERKNAEKGVEHAGESAANVGNFSENVGSSVTVVGSAEAVKAGLFDAQVGSDKARASFSAAKVGSDKARAGADGRSPEIPDADIIIFKPENYCEIPDLGRIAAEIAPKKLFLYLPPFMSGKDIEKITAAAREAHGVYCDGIWAVKFCESIQNPLFAGCGFNISNVVDIDLCQTEYFAISKELTVFEQKELSKPNAFALSVGNIKVMDLIYCPFGKRCFDCDGKRVYCLTDENGRKFPLVRYKTSDFCRFELYNCADLVSVSPVGSLIDCTLFGKSQLKEVSNVVNCCDDINSLKELFPNRTSGHSNSPVF